MSPKFNCPNCGASNAYSGEGNIVHCAYCGSDVKPPEEMVNQAAVARLGSRAKPWIILFIIVVFVLPMCGALIGFGASILGSIVAFLASFIGR